MASSNHLPNRQSSRMPWFDYRRSAYHFVTICTLGHHHAFGRIIDAEMHLSREGRICEQIWLSLPERFMNVAIDATVFMPNHVHGIIVIKKPPVLVKALNIPILYPSLRVGIGKLKIEIAGKRAPRLVGPFGMKALNLQIKSDFSTNVTSEGKSLTKFAS